MMIQSMSVRHNGQRNGEANWDHLQEFNFYQDPMNGGGRTLTFPIRSTPTQPIVLVFSIPGEVNSPLTHPVLVEDLDEEILDWDFHLRPPKAETKTFQAILHYAGKAKPRPISSCDDSE